MQQNKLKHWLHQLNLITPEQPLHFQLFPLRTLQDQKITSHHLFHPPPRLPFQESFTWIDAAEQLESAQTGLDHFQFAFSSICRQLYLFAPIRVIAKLKTCSPVSFSSSSSSPGCLDLCHCVQDPGGGAHASISSWTAPVLDYIIKSWNILSWKGWHMDTGLISCAQ